MFSIRIEPATFPQVPKVQSGYNQHQQWWWTSIRLGKRLMADCLVIRRDFELEWGWSWFPGIKAVYLGILWVEFLHGSPIITWCGKRVVG